MRSLLALLGALSLARHGDSAHVLGLFPHMGKSHQMVFEPLLRRLAERGHHITVVSFFPLKHPPANYTDVSLEGIAELGLETFDLSYVENAHTIFKTLSFPNLDRVVRQVSEFAPLAEMALEVCSKIVEFAPLADALKKEYDVMLVENFNSDCMLGLAHVYGVKAPKVALSSSALMPWSADRIGVVDNPSYLPIVSGHYPAKMMLWHRVQNTFFNYFYKAWFRYSIQLKEQAIIEKRFGKQIPDLRDLGRNVTMFMVNVLHSLNGVRPLLPGLVEVGGMHLNYSRKPEHIPAVSVKL